MQRENTKISLTLLKQASLSLLGLVAFLFLFSLNAHTRVPFSCTIFVVEPLLEVNLSLSLLISQRVLSLGCGCDYFEKYCRLCICYVSSR